MSVKTTQELTREEAENLYVELRAENLKKMLIIEALELTNDQLAENLEILDDALNDGESFRNYSIIGENNEK